MIHLDQLHMALCQGKYSGDSWSVNAEHEIEIEKQY